LSPSFIELWVGREYLLDRVSTGLLVAILYVMITRGTVDTFVNATGLFHDIWAPVIEAAINLGLSILLGSLFGLRGILSGMLLSLVLVVKGWKPYFFFSRWFRVPFRRYVVLYGRHVVAAAVATAVFVPLASLVRIDPAESWAGFVVYGAVVCFLFTVLLGGAMWVFTRGMRDCMARAATILKK
jgi:hypothetical protein